MRLSLQTFSTLVQNAAASVQASAAQLLDLSVGSSLRAILEANASLGLWVQWLILQVLQATRAATSTGGDLDTFLADYGVARLPATAATGTVTFGRFTALTGAVVPVGALVRTADGSQTYAVVADTTNAAYSLASGGYVVAATQPTVDAPVAAQTAGSAGNVVAGSVVQLVTAIPGVDTVVNAAGFSGGIDGESDAAVRARFQNFLATRSQATAAAVAFAVSGVQQGLTQVLQENIDESGAPRAGHFVLTVDDGSGAPSTMLLQSVQQAVDAVRPLGSTFSVHPPQIVTVNIGLTMVAAAQVQRAQAIAAVTAALTAYVNALPVGASLGTARVAQLAYDASPLVAAVSAIALNGGTSDVVPPPTGVIKLGTVVVS